MVNAIKGNTGDASLKNELSSKLKGISVKGAVQPPSSRGIVHHKEQVEYQCTNNKDDTRFMTAWFQINTNVKDVSHNADLKNLVVDNFVSGTDITDRNRANVENMVAKLNDQKLKKQLAIKLKAQKSKAKLTHHRTQVEYFINDQKDPNRYQTAWF